MSSFQSILLAMLQIVILAGLGFLLVKRSVLEEQGLKILSGLLVNIFLPCLVFFHLTQHFDYEHYTFWWVFPLMTYAVFASAFALSLLVFLVNKGCPYKRHFTALAAFQNDGFIPLILVATLFAGEAQNTLTVYIFLYIMGFDLGIWSLGVWLVTSQKTKAVQWKNLFNPPFVTILSTLCLIALGWHKFVPGTALKPIKMLADCTLPIAMIVAGGNLAGTALGEGRKRDIGYLLLVKLILLPAAGLLVVKSFHLDYLMGFFIVMQCAMPSAMLLSVIAKHFGADSRFVNQGIFWDTMLSVLTIPIFLTIYNQIVSG